jgi:membrane-associated phospholipid phosphatase
LIDPAFINFVCRILSQSINPFIAGIWGCIVLFDFRNKTPGWQKYCSASIVAVLLTQLAVHLFREGGFCDTQPNFPSGHEAFASSLITSMALWDRRWLLLLSPLALLLGISMVYIRMHSAIDVIGGAFLIPPCTILVHKLFGRTSI